MHVAHRHVLDVNDPSYWGPFIQHMTPERGPDVAIDFGDCGPMI